MNYYAIHIFYELKYTDIRHETDKGKRDAGLWMGIQIMENLTAALLWMQSGRKNARPSFPGFLMNLWNSALGQDNAGGFFIRKGDAAFR